MTRPRRCPQCGAELPADAPEGVCPKCLIQQGFESHNAAVGANPANDPTVKSSGFVAPSPEDLAPHFPQLEVVELLGKGGMGAVYKARQPNLDRHVALKILPPEVSRDPAFAERFTREARALAMLSHACIVAVHDFGEVDGLFYFVMEYVDGANLRQTIAAGGLTPAEALAIVPQVCDALQFAHDEGVVHRDIKPENILIDKRGRVKIADFGLAKLLGVDAEDSPAEKPFTLTGTHQIMGTPRYMAPEQMQGSHTVDHRADIYSLGVVIYEMLTGELPLGRFEPPSKKVQIDVRLDDVVLRSLESAPDRRYQRASEIKTDVESIAAATDIRLAPAAAMTAEFSASVRSRLKLPAMGVLVAGIVNLIATVVMPLVPILMNRVGAFPEEDGFVEGAGTFQEALFLSLIIAGFSLASGITQLIGAARMFDLQSHGIALLGSMAAILPCAVGFPISLPFGIWSLLVLSRQDVKTGFADWAAESRDQRNQEPGSIIGVTMPMGLMFGLVIGTAVDQKSLAVYIALGLILGLLFGMSIDMHNRRKSSS